MKEKAVKTMTSDAETIVRRAYHAAEGNVMDVQGFIDLFADDGVIHAGQKSFRGEELPYVVVFMGKLAPDVHRELQLGSRHGKRRRGRTVDPGHLHRAIRVAGRLHPTERSQARRPGHRLLVQRKQQDQGVQLLRQRQRHARTNGNTA